MRRWLSYYHPKVPIYLAYMLQQVENSPSKFLAWIITVPDLTKVMHRQRLVWTTKAKVLVVLIGSVWLFYMALAIFCFVLSPLTGIIIALISPGLITTFTYLLVLFGWWYIEEPRRNKLLKQATKAFAQHGGIKIAIAGSYGKTTVKELLNTVLSESRNVAATPGNKNVPISHAAWIKKLSGEEDILLIEYGEGAPGDIKKLAQLTHPDYGIITGLAPNHLDEYKHLDAVAKDLLSLGDYVDKRKLLIDTSSAAFKEYDLKKYQTYSSNEVLGWKIKGVTVDYHGTSFFMQHKSKKMEVRSGLLGKHLVAPLALTAALADQLGMSRNDIEAGLAKTVPFEHRMQPRRFHGAWIIDDTYNGSIEGLRAGLTLLRELSAKRKIYVTPGLVDQGEETERVHLEIGELIAAANPDRVVLMQNSVTQFILKGLESGEYKGDLHIEADPLAFYANLEHVVAAGDLIMMQNDWTDNYR